MGTTGEAGVRHHGEHADVTMMPSRPLRTVVVGLDGTPTSRAALEWAVDAIAPDGTVHAVHAVAPPRALDAAVLEIDSSDILDGARRSMDGAWTTGLPTTANLTRHVVEGTAADALLGVADEVTADLVVVGPHDATIGASRLVGRTIARLVRRSPLPIAVVRARPAVDGAGSIVVGVGSPNATRAAVEWAAALATSWQVGLTIVRPLPHLPTFDLEGVLRTVAYHLEPGVYRRWAVNDLAELADAVRRADPGPEPVTYAVPSGAVGARLVEASSEAALLVVGLEWPVGHTPPLWLHHAVCNAPCPVVIVPDPAT